MSMEFLRPMEFDRLNLCYYFERFCHQPDGYQSLTMIASYISCTEVWEARRALPTRQEAPRVSEELQRFWV